jgi:hypothetical protein
MITVADYAELAEPAGWRYGLCGGVVVRSPAPSPYHRWARSDLCAQLTSCVPANLTVDLGYVEDGEVTGVCTVDGPFPARLRLDELAR